MVVLEPPNQRAVSPNPEGWLLTNGCAGTKSPPFIYEQPIASKRASINESRGLALNGGRAENPKGMRIREERSGSPPKESESLRYSETAIDRQRGEAWALVTRTVRDQDGPTCC